MPETVSFRVIGRLHTEFPTKFGVPRQSGLADTRGKLVFEPDCRDPNALRGIEDYSHLWLIWQFSKTPQDAWTPTVRPPRLGGNTRMGVFATRSPYRPNPIGLSCVGLERVEWSTPDGPVLWVTGADLVDGTPILDVKPYLPFTDARPDARGGFTDRTAFPVLEVEIPPHLLERVPPTERTALREVLAQDPRPAYQADPARVYGFGFAGLEVRFTVSQGIARVTDIIPAREPV